MYIYIFNEIEWLFIINYNSLIISLSAKIPINWRSKFVDLNILVKHILIL